MYHGVMKNIIAYSIWGTHPMYWVGAKKNIQLAKKYFPNWICRFYVDSSCSKELIDSLIDENVEIKLVDSKDSFHGMFWRFWASEEEDVDIFLSRDCDSRFSDREYYAIQQWLNSSKDFHIMRDHPYHTTPILGGMWGCRNGLMRKIQISKLIESWGQYERKGIDQEFLAQIVYPLIKNEAMEHCDFKNLHFGSSTYFFPTKRKNSEFVGEIYDENDHRNPDHWKIIANYE